MNVKDLERLLTDAGATASKVATITGKLREQGKLPKAGRGPHAPQIGPKEAALVLLAVAGSSRANESGQRIEKLERLALRSSDASADAEVSLVERFIHLLDDPDRAGNVEEARISRTIGRATIIYRNGAFEEFTGPRTYNLDEKFRAVGELPGGLLKRVATLLKVKMRTRRRSALRPDRD